MSRAREVTLAGLGLTVLFAWTLMPIQEFDVWFYLQIGKEVLEEGRIPWAESYLGTTDVYAYHRHANTFWLSSTLVFLFYKLGGMAGLVFCRSLLLTAITGVTYLNCRLLGLEPRWSLLLSALGLWTARSRFLLRSVLFSDLFLALLLTLLIVYERSRDKGFPYLKLAVLMAVWSNSHQGVVVALAALGTWLLTRTVDWPTRVKAVLVAGLALLIRPYGWWFPAFFWETFGNTSAIAGVAEWEPLSPYNMVIHLGPLLLLMAVVSLRSVGEREFPWGNLIVAGVFVLFALQSQRLVGELLPVAIPMLASMLVYKQPPEKLRAGFLLVLVTLFSLTWMGEPSRLTELKPKYPAGLVAELPAEHGQLFNSYEFGNYLVFREKKPFIHGITALYREQLVLDFQDVLNPSERRWQILDQFEVEVAMLHHPTEVDATEDLVKTLFTSEDWSLHWWDDAGYLFVKGGSRDLRAVIPWEARPWLDPAAAAQQLDAMLAHRPSALALNLRGQLALELGDPQGALNFVNQALALEPNFYPALITRGSLLFQGGQVKESRRTLERAVAANPKAAIARFNLALALLAESDSWLARRRARYQLQKALELKPELERAQQLLQQF